MKRRRFTMECLSDLEQSVKMAGAPGRVAALFRGVNTMLLYAAHRGVDA